MTTELRPYPEYKDSGLPWLGRVPAHWDVERAKWLYRQVARPVRESDEVVTCFRDGTVTLRKNRRTLGFTNSLKEIGYQGIRKGDLAIHAMDAFAGAVGVSDSDGKCTPVYAICTPKADLDSRYYAYVIREMARSQWILALSRGIRERSTDFRFDGFGAQPVPVPCKDEQRRIADYLDANAVKVRRFIHNRRRLIELLNEQKQAIINRAVTRGLDPNVPLKPSGIDWLGDIPEHWEVKRIKTLTKILRGKFSHRPRNDPSLYDGEFPFIQTGDVARASKYITGYKQTLNARGYAVSKEFPKGTLTMTIAANIGDVAILDFAACFPDSIVGFVPQKSVLLEFLFYLFTAMKSEFLKEAPVNTQGNLNIERIGSMSGVIPDFKNQRIVVDYI